MTAPDLNQGALAPVADEVEIAAPRVTGNLPRERPGARSEDDGWLLACIYRRASDTSDVVVVDAGDLESGPIATVHLPRRIPAGFHSTWVPSR